jgi:hypothetical protein
VSLLLYFLRIPQLEVFKEGDERSIQYLPALDAYDNSPFIKKLLIVGFEENIAAKTQFFNAELLATEIHDKGDENEINELVNLYEKIRSMWEPRFNEALKSDNPDVELPKVYTEMSRSIEELDKGTLNSPRILASFVHKLGFMQQLADKCEIGWSKDFRNIDSEKTNDE